VRGSYIDTVLTRYNLTNDGTSLSENTVKFRDYVLNYMIKVAMVVAAAVLLRLVPKLILNIFLSPELLKLTPGMKK
jgi:hypothetical protein